MTLLQNVELMSYVTLHIHVRLVIKFTVMNPILEGKAPQDFAWKNVLVSLLMF